MKKIINGKKYDTDTATFFHQEVIEDNNVIKEFKDFYQKKNGEIFMHHWQENAIEKGFDHIVIWYPDEQIDLKLLLEKFLSVEKYEEIFGEVSE